MYNLIVTGDLRGNGRGSIPASRVFEYSSDSLSQAPALGGKLSVDAVCNLPTIVMQEGHGDEIAYCVSLTSVRMYGTKYEFKYTVDPDVPQLTNADIQSFASELEVDDFEFYRNHWAVKDVDLFQFLYRLKVAQHPAPEVSQRSAPEAAQRPAPNVFQLSCNPVNPNLVSMMMPFSGDFDKVYRKVKMEIEENGYECRRADDIWKHDQIMQDIIELICTSQVVICDLSGKNPNVLYEAGIAHTLGKEVILMTQSINDVPFDLRSIRFISYLNNEEGRDKLASDILKRLKTLLENRF